MESSTDEPATAGEANEEINMDQLHTMEMIELSQADDAEPLDLGDLVEVDEVHNDCEALDPVADVEVVPEVVDEEQNQQGEPAPLENEQVQETAVDGEDDFEDESDDDDDDDDDVKITIGDVKTNINFPSSGGTRSSGGTKFIAGKMDLDEVAMVNGTPVYEVDMSALEEHPWREPGADLTDYFNYGFTEDTWNIYCDRQRRLRAEYGPENANRYYFNSMHAHYPSTMMMDRSRAFVPSAIPTVGAQMAPTFPALKTLPPNNMLPQIPIATPVPVFNANMPAGESTEATNQQENQSEKSAGDATAKVEEVEKHPENPSEAMGTGGGGYPMMVPGRGMHGGGVFPMHGFPPGPLPHMASMPMPGVPPPGMMPPFGPPPHGLGFPPAFQYHPPHRPMFLPRGYAGFRPEFNEYPRRRSVDSYSEHSSDGQKSYGRPRKRSEYDYYKQSRSRENSRDYARFDRGERPKRRHSRSRERHRSREDYAHRSRHSSRSGHRKTSDKKESSRVRDKVEVKRENKDDFDELEMRADQSPEYAEQRKAKEKGSKSAARTKHRGDLEKKERDRRRESKSSGQEEFRSSSAKKRKKRKGSRH